MWNIWLDNIAMSSLSLQRSLNSVDDSAIDLVVIHEVAW